MERLPTDRRAELYLRGDTYGTFEAQQEILDRVRDLESDSALADIEVDWSWERIRTIDEDHRDGALETYREFADWAEHNGYDLLPAFERRSRGFVGLDRVEEVVVFPVACLAVYHGSDLEAVFPCTDEGRSYRVQDCLDALDRGDPDWLAQFDAVSVDRTTPRIEANLGA